MNKKNFIVFEGGEGSGKTTAMNQCAEYLRAKGMTVVTTHEPGGTKLGQKIRALLLETYSTPIFSQTELLLFLADRAQHVQEFILPHLQQGAVVLCDRFTGSTLAYQIGARGLAPAELITAMEQYARQNLEPELVLYLDVDPMIGIARKQIQKEVIMNRLDKEKMEFHAKVRAYFLELSKTQPHWVTIDSHRPMPDVHQEVLTHITHLFK
ncbi:MAG TPA: dTMP kinase [Patescibacteria group bacterium]|nr:dTMP kinase [Patescibacteria group bacterium]